MVGGGGASALRAWARTTFGWFYPIKILWRGKQQLVEQSRLRWGEAKSASSLLEYTEGMKLAQLIQGECLVTQMWHPVLNLHSSAALHSDKFNPHLPIGIFTVIWAPWEYKLPHAKWENLKMVPKMRFSKRFYCAQYLAGIAGNYSSSVDISKTWLFFFLLFSLEEAPPRLWIFNSSLSYATKPSQDMKKNISFFFACG